LHPLLPVSLFFTWLVCGLTITNFNSFAATRAASQCSPQSGAPHSEIAIFRAEASATDRNSRNHDFNPNRRLCCLDFHGVDVRHATSSAFKDIMDIKVPKSRRSGEPHNASAAWATRRPWRVFTRMFVAHGRKRSLNRCPGDTSFPSSSPDDDQHSEHDGDNANCAADLNEQQNGATNSLGGRWA
jgi:hypothetical protein